MQLRYNEHTGKPVIVHLGDNPIVVGRSMEADLVLSDENISRKHLIIRKWDNDYAIKDLNSENGTFVNGKMVDIAKLHVGDQINIGSYIIICENKTPKPPNTVIRKIGKKMATEDKGYNTLLIEFVDEADKEYEQSE